MSNSVGVSGYPVSMISARQQMEAYDDLPEALRAMIGSGPFQLSAWHVRAFWKEHGVDAAVAEIESSFAAYLEAAEKEMA